MADRPKALLRRRLKVARRRARPASAIGRLALTCGLLLLAGCESPQEKCRKENAENEAGYERCWNAVLQQQNAYLNHLWGESFRSKE